MIRARLHSEVGSPADSRAGGPGFDTWSSHILCRVKKSSNCRQLLLRTLKPVQEHDGMVRSTDHPDKTIAVCSKSKTTTTIMGSGR